MEPICQSCGRRIMRGHPGKLYVFPGEDPEEEWHCDQCVSTFYECNPRDGWAGIAVALVNKQGQSFDINLQTGELF